MSPLFPMFLHRAMSSIFAAFASSLFIPPMPHQFSFSKAILFGILLILAVSCRSAQPIISAESSCRGETAFEQSRSAQSSSSFLSSLSQTFDADSIRILFALPKGQVPFDSFESDEVPATDILEELSAASITFYGAHFESKEEASTNVESTSSDSISSSSSLQSESKEHVSPPSSVTQNTPKGSVLRNFSNPCSKGAFRTFVLSLLKKFVFLPLLILLLAALTCYAVRAAIRRLFR